MVPTQQWGELGYFKNLIKLKFSFWMLKQEFKTNNANFKKMLGIMNEIKIKAI